VAKDARTKRKLKEREAPKPDVATVERKHREVWAAIVAAVIAAPLVYMFAAAIADGQVRAAEAPMRALLGPQAYTALERGERTQLHYMGRDRTAPDFTLRDREGRAWQLSDHRGKVVVLNFWSITCPPCLEEMPSLIDLAKLLEDRDDVELVAISTDAGWGEVANVFPRDSTLNVIFDPEKAVTRGKFGTRLYPETWFIDPHGVIRLRIDGPKDWSQPIVLELIDALRS
jgi:peroxiredoxin